MLHITYIKLVFIIFIERKGEIVYSSEMKNCVFRSKCKKYGCTIKANEVRRKRMHKITKGLGTGGLYILMIFTLLVQSSCAVPSSNKETNVQYEDGFESSIDIKDEVLQFPKRDFEDKDYKFENDQIAKGDEKGRLTLPNIKMAKALQVGDVFLLPSNSVYSTVVAQKVYEIVSKDEDNIVLITVAPELSEFLGEGGIKIKGSTEGSTPVFTPGEGFEIVE